MSKYFMHYSPRNRLTVNPVRGFESHRLRQKPLEMLSFQGFSLCLILSFDCGKNQNGAHGAEVCGARPVNEIFGISLLWC